MSEAQPAKKVGGHTYGRRNVQLSNTVEEVSSVVCRACDWWFSASSMRYDSQPVCGAASAREGRLSFDISRLLKEQKRSAKFWSQADIGAPDECWNWNGCINKRTDKAVKETTWNQ